MAAAIETIGLRKQFGGISAASDVSLRIESGARHALIGPNGAGKTTLINLLTGVLAPSAGAILLDGRDITRLAPHRRVQRGLARTFQINQLFGAMTPLEAVKDYHDALHRQKNKAIRDLAADSAITEPVLMGA